MRDSYASTAFADDRRPLGARGDRALHRRALADGADRRLHGLGVAPRVRAGQAGAARREGAQESDAARATTRAGASSERDGVEPCIVPLPQDRRFAGEAWQNPPYDVIYQAFLLEPAVVAQRDDRRARRHASSTRTWSRSRRGSSSTCSRRRTRCSPIPRCWSARAARAAMNLVRGAAELRRGLGARDRRPAARRRRAFEVGPQRRGHAGQGRLSQPADRADPVRAGDRQRCGRSRC